MFTAGRIDRQKNLKRVHKEITEIFSELAEDVVDDLSDSNYLQLIKRYKKMKDDVCKIKSSYDALMTSSLTCGSPNIVVHNHISNEKSQTVECLSETENKSHSDLTWDDIRELITEMSEKEQNTRNRIYSTEAQKFFVAELYPTVMKDDIFSAIRDDFNMEKHCARFIAMKYQEICEQYIRDCRKLVQDNRVLQTHQRDNITVFSYPIIFTCKWVADFCADVETVLTNEVETPFQFMKKTCGLMENKMYKTVSGADISTNLRSKQKTSIYKIYALDIPYHMCRFLSMFGSLLFVPTKLDKQFQHIERFSDIELFLHFALKYHNEEKYRHYLKNEVTFFKKNKRCIVDALKKAIALFLTCDTDNGIVYDVLKDGEIRLHVYEKIDDVSNLEKDPGSIQKYKTKLMEVPHDILRVLRTFMLANLDEFRKEYTRAYLENKMSEFEAKYAEYILSPLGKLLNFDKQVQSDFASFHSEIQGEIPIARYMFSKIPLMPSIVNIYTTLLQAAYAIREICDPIDLKYIDPLIFLENVIVDGDLIEYPGTLSYISVFEAFPGLFYFNFVSPKHSERNGEVREEEMIAVLRLFEYYIGYIPKLSKCADLSTKTLMLDLIKPDSIRWINGNRIMCIHASQKRYINKIKCKFLNICKKKKQQMFNMNADSKWKYFIEQIPEKKLLKTDFQIERAYFSPDPKKSIRAFYTTPITMGIEVKLCEVSKEFK